jgi:hypothetical protein
MARRNVINSAIFVRMERRMAEIPSTLRSGRAQAFRQLRREFRYDSNDLMRALALVSLIAFFLCATVASAAVVSGTVREAGTNVPLAGKIVAAYDASGQLRGTATTDPTGLYVLNLDPGSYRILAYDLSGIYATMFDANAESFETSPLRTIPASGATISFALVRAGTVIGRVRGNGNGLSGMVVDAYNLSGTRRGSTTTDANGDYSLVLPPGEYKLVAYDPLGFYGHAFYEGEHSFEEATAVRVDPGVPRGANFTLEIAARAIGTVVDAATNVPLAAMLVYAYSSDGTLVGTTVTDSAGQFRFSLPGGNYRFVAADASGNYATGFYENSRAFETSRVVTLVSGQLRGDLRIALARGAHIRGHVNAPNLFVAAYNLDGTLHATTTSNANGDYTLLVAPGDYRIAVSDLSGTYATRFFGDASSFRVAQTVTASVDISGIDVTLPVGGRITGTTRDASGNPLPGISVVAYDAAGLLIGSATSGSDGRYTLVLAPGPYRVLAFDPNLGYATSYAGAATTFEATIPLNVTAGTSTTVDFTMRPGMRLTGTVKTDQGTSLDAIEIFAIDANGNRVAGATSSNGTFTLVLRPGTYRFIAVDPQGRYPATAPTAPTTITEGQLPPPLALTVTTPARRRAVRH